MNRVETYRELHRPEVMPRWEWRADGADYLVAVPRDSADTTLPRTSNWPGDNAIYLFCQALPAISFVLFVYIAMQLMHSQYGPIAPGLCLVWLLILDKSTDLARACEERTDLGESGLYKMAVPYNDSGDHTEMVKNLALFLNHQKERQQDSPQDSQDSRDDFRYFEFMEYFNGEMDSGALTRGLRWKHFRDEIEETAQKQRAIMVARGENPDASLERANKLEAEKAKEEDVDVPIPGAVESASELCAFYAGLSPEHGELRELTTVMKRWDDLYRCEQVDFRGLSNEIAPMVKTLKQAEELGRDDLARNARATLEKSLALAESVAAATNKRIDKGKMENLTISAMSLRTRFPLYYQAIEGAQGDSEEPTHLVN